MKKPMLLSAMLIVLASLSYGQSDYMMFESIYLEPNLNELKQLGENMKSHNNTYHSQDPYRASVWNVLSGKNSGKLAWIMGPCTFSDLDNRPSDGGHDDDWRDNIMVHIDEMSGGAYWRLMDGFSYQPENMTPKVMWARYMDVKRGKMDEFEHLMTTIMKNYQENAFGHSMGLYENVVNDGSGRDVAIVWQYNNYAYLDTELEFSKKYEEIYGDNSWRDFMEAIYDYTESVEDELFEVMPAMSAD